MHYNFTMKSAQLPPVRVTPAVRAQIESVLKDGETLSEFVEAAAVQAAQRRKSQEEFVARGRASLQKAQRTGEFFPVQEVLDGMQARLQSAVKAARASDSNR